MKVVLLLYLSLPLTRGSGVVYRRWLHPLLCSREQDIDRMLEQVECGVELQTIHRAFSVIVHLRQLIVCSSSLEH